MSDLKRRPNLAVLVFLSALAVLPVNMFVPSLPGIAREFGADYALANLAIAGYAVVSAVTHLVSGALSDRYGRRPVALASLGVFVAASFGCSVATDMEAFLAFRLLQGVVIACYAAALAAIRDTSDEHDTTARISRVSSAWALAPMIGPALGGLLDACFGWRASFVAFFLLGSIGFAATLIWFKETNTKPSSSILDIGGYGIIVRSRLFWAYALCMVFSIGTLYVFLGSAPLIAENDGSVSSITLGLYMGLVPAGFVAGSTLATRTGRRYTPHRLMVAGRWLTLIGLLTGLALCLAEVRHVLAFFGPCIFIGLGNGLTMPAANAGVLHLKPGLAGTAIGLANALTAAGAATVASLAGYLIGDEDAVFTTLAILLACAVAALLSALSAASLGRT